MAEVDTVERRKDAESKQGPSLFWQQQLDLADKDHDAFLKEGKKVADRYKGEAKAAVTRGGGRKRFNILFSNTETLKAAVFAKMAKPDVRRRFSDQDPIGKAVAEITERSLVYCGDVYDAEAEFDAALEDYLLPGRGVVWVCYEAETTSEPKSDADGGAPPAQGGAQEYVANQELYLEHVYWEDFRHQPARRWRNVEWVARRHKMSREDLERNGFKNAEKVPLNWSPEPTEKGKEVPDSFKRAEVWEVWDRTKRERHWVVKGFASVLRTDPDPYGLEDFYPLAEPIQGITTTSTFIPKPEFSIYEDQADGLDEIEDRIDRLTRALKRRGVYDATFKELERLARAGDNQFIAVKNYADLSTKGGLAAAFQTEDLSVIAAVLKELHAQRDLRVQTIYEVVGIADIMRGASDPRETLGAQKIKAQFGGNRLKKRQVRVQNWIKNTLRLKAEIIAEHMEPSKLAEMTGVPVDVAAMQPPPPFQPTGDPEQDQQAQQQSQQAQQEYQAQVQKAQEIIKVLRSDRLRSYRIDVETDSTIFEDAEAEKAATVEMLGAMSTFLEKGVMAGQQSPELVPLIFEMIEVGLRAFKQGRSLEDTLEQVKTKVMEKAANPQPQQDPKLEAEKVKAEAVKAKTEMDMQAAQQKQQMDMEAAQAKQALEQQKMQMEMQKMQAELQFMQQKMGLEAQQMQMEAQAGQQRMAMEQQADEQRMSMDRESMNMEQERSQREHELGTEAMQTKHDMGLEMMAEKAKQAKQKPEARR